MVDKVVDREKPMSDPGAGESKHSQSFLRRHLHPHKLKSLSSLKNHSPASPASSRGISGRSFRFSKSLLSRRGSRSPLADRCDPCKDDEAKKTTLSSSPSKRKRNRGINFLLRPTRLVRNGSKDSKGSGGSITEASDEDMGRSQTKLESTRIVSVASPSSKTRKRALEERAQASSCATSILGHSYLECCGMANHSLEEQLNDLAPLLSEDPTIQESVECVFASQLEDGLELWDEDEVVQSISAENRLFELQSPAMLQQSKLNRLNREPSVLAQHMSRYHQANLKYFGTYDPAKSPLDEQKTLCENPLSCPCLQSDLPALNPEDWPQAPLLLRPTPGSGTKIKGVRFANETDHLWKPSSGRNWPDELASRWGKPVHDATRYSCCENCAILPINNGNEERGKSLVIDFETDDFEGSFLLRLRFTEGTTPEPYDDKKGYFLGVNRRYQVVVRGRFKKSIPMTQLSTGFRLNRPCGKLPPKWILRGGIKVLKFFAPQLDAKLEGDQPRSLTPLGSTPQSLTVETEEIDCLDGIREEPSDGKKTLLGEASSAETSLQRSKFRKKNFDKLFVEGSIEPKTDPSKIYTFEFLQHLFNFQEFSIELGSMLGSIQLEHVLDGQPLQVMATHEENPLWSFDIWHQCLWDKAVQNDRSGRR
eukprot:scaffold1184_cov132-Cylindrotheca_fusiformis.AAC.83